MPKVNFSNLMPNWPTFISKRIYGRPLKRVSDPSLISTTTPSATPSSTSPVPLEAPGVSLDLEKLASTFQPISGQSQSNSDEEWSTLTESSDLLKLKADIEELNFFTEAQKNKLNQILFNSFQVKLKETEGVNTFETRKLTEVEMEHIMLVPKFLNTFKHHLEVAHKSLFQMIFLSDIETRGSDAGVRVVVSENNIMVLCNCSAKEANAIFELCKKSLILDKYRNKFIIKINFLIF